MSKMEGSAGRRLAWKEHWRWVSGHSRGPPAPYSGSHGGAPPRASGLLSARRLDQHLGCLSDAGSPNGRSCHKCPEGTERTRSPAEGLAQGGEGCTCKTPRGPSHLGQREPPRARGSAAKRGSHTGVEIFQDTGWKRNGRRSSSTCWVTTEWREDNEQTSEPWTEVVAPPQGMLGEALLSRAGSPPCREENSAPTSHC